jgi:HAD superfamily hydrolase (TIGR01509 family)
MTTPATAPVLSLRTAEAVICDFNGTLSDDETLLGELVAAVAADRLGLDVPLGAYRADLAGLSDTEILTRLRRRRPTGPPVAELLADLTRRYRAATADGDRIRPGTRALLHELASAGTPLALVTGAVRDSALPPLHAAGVAGLFAVVLTDEDVDAGKPDPEGFLRAAAQLGADPARTVVLEDSLPGLTAAGRAGMVAVAVGTTHPGTALERLAAARVDVLEPGLADLPLTLRG